jgi:hypothetical protein
MSSIFKIVRQTLLSRLWSNRSTTSCGCPSLNRMASTLHSFKTVIMTATNSTLAILYPRLTLYAAFRGTKVPLAGLEIVVLEPEALPHRLGRKTSLSGTP